MQSAVDKSGNNIIGVAAGQKIVKQEVMSGNENDDEDDEDDYVDVVQDTNKRKRKHKKAPTMTAHGGRGLNLAQSVTDYLVGKDI